MAGSEGGAGVVIVKDLLISRVICPMKEISVSRGVDIFVSDNIIIF